MMWQYTRRESKVLLLATLCTFSGYGLLVANDWRALEEKQATSQLAQSISVFAGVEQNQINTMSAELDARAQELAVREAALLAAESSSSQQDRTVLLIVTLVGLALLGLILFNFYLDSKRRVSLA